MLKDTLAKIEAAILRANSMDVDKRSELIRLLSTLKTEVAQLSKTHSEHAHSIAGFVEVATHEAARKLKAPTLRKVSLEGVSSSVAGFEASHPVLVKTADDICSLLSQIGI